MLSALADAHRREVVMVELFRRDGGERACVSFPLPVAESTGTWDEFDARFPGLLDVVAGISTAG
ncbi:hypothetical protein [Amycolatopsis sp. MtRt-6]|uniref:hypothetical protein n=1 Tax=Amycolatopsis sp. MtRt-6 TaxID=2792782 RepID=UPI001A8F46CA|nr:hypothetical protein [Amycolatopsis sp. MtRt-6]